MEAQFLNTNYYIRFKIYNNIATVSYSLDGITFIDEISHSFSVTQKTTVILGSNSPNYLKGSIDLNNTYISIYENGEWIKWFKGQPARESNPQCSIVACTGNNLTKVGSPIIDENGVASGFDSSSYLTLPYEVFSDFEFGIKFTTGNSTSGDRYLFSGYNANGTFLIRVRNSKILINYGTGNSFYSNYTINPNTTYSIKITYKASKLSLYILVDGVYTLDNSIVCQKLTYSLRNRIGIYSLSDADAFNGSIDLNNTYIKVGNNYLMRGYLTDSDKLIATNKNWDLKLT